MHTYFRPINSKCSSCHVMCFELFFFSFSDAAAPAFDTHRHHSIPSSRSEERTWACNIYISCCIRMSATGFPPVDSEETAESTLLHMYTKIPGEVPPVVHPEVDHQGIFRGVLNMRWWWWEWGGSYMMMMRMMRERLKEFIKRFGTLWLWSGVSQGMQLMQSVRMNPKVDLKHADHLLLKILASGPDESFDPIWSDLSSSFFFSSLFSFSPRRLTGYDEVMAVSAPPQTSIDNFLSYHLLSTFLSSIHLPPSIKVSILLSLSGVRAGYEATSTVSGIKLITMFSHIVIPSFLFRRKDQ